MYNAALHVPVLCENISIDSNSTVVTFVTALIQGAHKIKQKNDVLTPSVSFGIEYVCCLRLLFETTAEDQQQILRGLVANGLSLSFG